MNAKTWRRRLGKITFPDHAEWMWRGLTLLTDEELDELEALQERVVAVDLEGMADDELERLQALHEQMGGETDLPAHLRTIACRGR